MKISKLHIDSFRGIPGVCDLSFVSRGNKPVSSIIYGVNGSGKSSIVDALEFCLQGRIERSTVFKNPSRPSVINLSKDSIIGPSIKIEFEDGSHQERRMIIDYDEENVDYKISSNDYSPNPKYSLSPIALRRNDIISYNMTKEAERQLLLLQFMYHENIDNKLSKDPVVLEIDKKVLFHKRERDRILEEIPKVVDISVETLRENSTNIVQCISERYSPIGQKFGFTRSGIPKKHIDAVVYDNAISLATKYSEITAKIKKLTKKKREIINIKKPERFEELKETFSEASKYLTSAFKEISTVNYIKDINLSVADITTTSLSIKITLENGQEVAPNQIFSEANYDLMILLLYLSVIRVSADKGQEKVLVLDDVLQSVDTNIRAKFIIYILKELKDWQLFITCHDRLWLSQLKCLFQNASHLFKEYHITNWAFSTGPVIIEEKITTKDDTLEKAIATGNIRIMAAMSGLFLEKICQELSMSIGTSVHRTRGDVYTIGELWPGIKKAFKKTKIEPLVGVIDNLLYIRNLLGCHYNQWAEALGDEEVREFASSVQKLYDSCFCSICNTWLESSSGNTNTFECKCRHLSY